MTSAPLLLAAVLHGHQECARILVEAGAAVDRVGHDGRSQAEWAVRVFGAEHPLTRELLAPVAS